MYIYIYRRKTKNNEQKRRKNNQEKQRKTKKNKEKRRKVKKSERKKGKSSTPNPLRTSLDIKAPELPPGLEMWVQTHQSRPDEDREVGVPKLSMQNKALMFQQFT